MSIRTPAVSVVLPTFNRLKYLRPAVDSVFAQSCDDWELIIADDGSGTETMAYLRTLLADARVRLLAMAHSGSPSVVRNAALREARGEYVAFLDSDDVWLPRKLEAQLDALRASHCRWSYTALMRVNESGEVIPYTRLRQTPGGSILKQLLCLEVAVATPAVMVERTLLNEVHGFDEEQPYFEEYDLWLRLNLRAPVCAVAEPLVQIRNHEQHYSADRIGVFRARLRLLDKLSTVADLGSALRAERAKTAGALAEVLAVAERRVEALHMLLKSMSFAANSPRNLARAAMTAARVFAPSWLRALVRPSGRPQGRTLNKPEAQPTQQADHREGYEEHGGHGVQSGVKP